MPSKPSRRTDAQITANFLPEDVPGQGEARDGPHAWDRHDVTGLGPAGESRLFLTGEQERALALALADRHTQGRHGHADHPAFEPGPATPIVSVARGREGGFPHPPQGAVSSRAVRGFCLAGEVLAGKMPWAGTALTGSLP
ncbi:hypothetical protein ACFXBB_35490 [Streptomyces scopuliridis]|uniref:hypothetical protein n=1 Tax=Streptomyces scopuliridis TaxID=452529 RepID=UPI0036B03EAE